MVNKGEMAANSVSGMNEVSTNKVGELVAKLVAHHCDKRMIRTLVRLAGTSRTVREVVRGRTLGQVYTRCESMVILHPFKFERVRVRMTYRRIPEVLSVVSAADLRVYCTDILTLEEVKNYLSDSALSATIYHTPDKMDLQESNVVRYMKNTSHLRYA